MSISKKYNALDMLNMATLMEADMEWTAFMIADIKKRLKEVKAELGEKNIIALHYLEQAVNLYQYVTECRFDYHASEAEKFKLECNHINGGEHDNTP